MYYTNIIYDDGWKCCRRMKMKTSEKKIKVFLKLFFCARLCWLCFLTVWCSFAFCARNSLVSRNFFLFFSILNDRIHTPTQPWQQTHRVWSIIIARVAGRPRHMTLKGFRRLSRSLRSFSWSATRISNWFSQYTQRQYLKMNTRHTWIQDRTRSWGDDRKSANFFFFCSVEICLWQRQKALE